MKYTRLILSASIVILLFGMAYSQSISVTGVRQHAQAEGGAGTIGDGSATAQNPATSAWMSGSNIYAAMICGSQGLIMAV
jgi:hypothetical protein